MKFHLLPGQRGTTTGCPRGLLMAPGRFLPKQPTRYLAGRGTSESRRNHIFSCWFFSYIPPPCPNWEGFLAYTKEETKPKYLWVIEENKFSSDSYLYIVTAKETPSCKLPGTGFLIHSSRAHIYKITAIALAHPWEEISSPVNIYRKKIKMVCVCVHCELPQSLPTSCNTWKPEGRTKPH